MSGLKVQPKKTYGSTTRILGYHFGNHDTAEYNWELRLSNVATQVANSVKQRVLLFNTVVLPSILFTGQHFPITAKALQKLIHVQKSFVWKGTTKDVLNVEGLGFKILRKLSRSHGSTKRISGYKVD
ncbi:RxLR effector protein [Phytophthora megakarya]|uniref:RxLR effector protein n=1 Tax=Phytophthora megakarya TaxID=4795 RepID=A0A225VAM0_9STRA|nr:RxLR effector protein [Phytophthora megakarya]